MKVKAPFVGVLSPYSGFFHLYALAGNKFLVLIGAIVGPEYIDLRLSECERYEINTVKQWYARHGYAKN